MANRPELAAAFPHPGHRSPELFVRDVQVALHQFDVGVAEHQLDGADVDAVGQEPAGAFMSCQCRSIWRSLARSTRAPGFARFVSWPFATRSRDSQAVLKLSTYAPAGEPNTNALGPSDLRRLRIGARRPSGSNGMRRFSGQFDRNANPADGVGSLTNGPRTHPAHAEGAW